MLKDPYLERPYPSIEIFKKLELLPKESKDKQIDQNIQKYLAKCDADCGGNIFKKRKVF